MSTTIQRPASAATEHSRADTPRQNLLHAGFILAALLFVVLYARTYIGLAEIWAGTGTFQYAFLIFPISALLVYSRRAWLARVVARPRPIGLVALALLSGLWLLGRAAEINLAQHIAVVLVWPALVYTFYGPRVAGVIAFALAYLVFAIPFGNFLVAPLQTVTAHMAVAALKLTGVPVLMDGHFIDTPASSWHVAEACSGIKFFVALTAFGVLYAHLFYNSWRRRIGFVIAAMVVPILANGLRVYFTILIGEYIGMHYATGTDHLIFGWQFFGTVLFLLFIAGWPWHEAPSAPPPAEQGVAAAPHQRVLATSVAALVLVIGPAAWFAATGAMADASIRTAQATLPDRLAGRDAVADDAMSVSDLSGVADHVTRRYGHVADPVRVDYLVPAAGRDVTALRQALFDPTQWQVVDGPTPVATENNGPTFVALTLSRSGGRYRQRLLYSYRVGDDWVTSSAALKRRQIVARLTGQPLTTGLLVVSEYVAGAPGPLPAMGSAAARALVAESSR